jgi:hypothetical protein
VDAGVLYARAGARAFVFLLAIMLFLDLLDRALSVEVAAIVYVLMRMVKECGLVLPHDPKCVTWYSRCPLGRVGIE